MNIKISTAYSQRQVNTFFLNSSLYGVEGKLNLTKANATRSDTRIYAVNN